MIKNRPARENAPVFLHKRVGDGELFAESKDLLPQFFKLLVRMCALFEAGEVCLALTFFLRELLVFRYLCNLGDPSSDEFHFSLFHIPCSY